MGLKVETYTEKVVHACQLGEGTSTFESVWDMS